MATKEEAIKARIAELAAQREGRDPYTLSRFGMKRLDKYTPDQLDFENYVYCFQNDEKANIQQQLTYGYEFVETSEIKDYKTYENNGETSTRVRELAGTDEENKKMYTYMMKIPRVIWEYDQQQEVEARKAKTMGNLTKMNAADLPNASKNSVGLSGVYALEGNQTSKIEPLATQTVTKKRSQ